jgi:hypothetical protein
LTHMNFHMKVTNVIVIDRLIHMNFHMEMTNVVVIDNYLMMNLVTDIEFENRSIVVNNHHLFYHIYSS